MYFKYVILTPKLKESDNILRNNKYKDLFIVIILTIIVSMIGFKLIENYIYFWNFIRKLFGLLVPVLYGFIIAYILNPLVKLIKRKLNIKEGFAILSAYLLLIILIIAISIFFLPNMISSATDMAQKMPEYIKDIQGWIDSILKNNNLHNILSDSETVNNLNNILSSLGTMVMSLFEGIASGLFTVSTQIIKIFLGLLISMYVLIDKERIILETKKICYIVLKENRANKLIESVRIYNSMIGAYIGIKAIDSAIIGGMALILLTIVKSEYPLLLAVIVGVTNMIPYFGPFVGEIVGFIFNIFISPTKAIVVFLTLLALQQFDGWYLDPKLIGNKVGVRPLYIIIAVIVAGGFFGPIGMLLASPTVATLKVYYERLMNKNAEKIKNVEEY